MASKDQFSDNEQILRKSIKDKNIGNVYLFFGAEEYLKRNFTEYIEKILLTEELKLLNKIVLEGKTTPAAIIDNCETLPVFSERKMVIVRNSGLFKGGKKKDEAIKKAGDSGRKGKNADELTSFLQNVPDHVCLIFIEVEIDKRIKLVDLVNSYGLVVELDYRKPDELTNWVMKRIRELGHEADQRTAAMIVEYGEAGMDDLMNEIRKLCAFAGQRQKITESDVAKVCTKSIKSRVFDLTDAIAAKQTAKALSLLNDMAVLKEPMPKIMYMIARQFRQLVQVKMMVRDGVTQAQIAALLKSPPFIAGKLIKQAQSFQTDKLENAISSSLDLDIAIKTGKLEDRLAVELMITGLTL